jgi:hypothetical protein
MKIEEVPQDGKRTMRTRMVHYAVDDKGEFVKVGSDGWEPGYRALIDLRSEFDDNAAEARERVKNDQTSPLEYFMYKAYMELPTLAQMTGFSQRKVRKHFKPAVFEKLNDEILQRYADVLIIDIKDLKNFEKELK